MRVTTQDAVAAPAGDVFGGLEKTVEELRLFARGLTPAGVPAGPDEDDQKARRRLGRYIDLESLVVTERVRPLRYGVSLTGKRVDAAAAFRTVAAGSTDSTLQSEVDLAFKGLLRLFAPVLRPVVRRAVVSAMAHFARTLPESIAEGRRASEIGDVADEA